MCFHWWDAPNKSQKQWDAFIIPSCSVVAVPRSIFQYFLAPCVPSCCCRRSRSRCFCCSVAGLNDNVLTHTSTEALFHSSLRRSLLPPTPSFSPSLLLLPCMDKWALDSAFTPSHMSLTLLLLFLYTLNLYSLASACSSSSNPVFIMCFLSNHFSWSPVIILLWLFIHSFFSLDVIGRLSAV